MSDKGIIVIYNTESNGTKVEVKLIDGNLWLTQEQIVSLTTRANRIFPSISSISWKKGNSLKRQLFGNSELFKKKANAKLKEALLITIST